MKKLLFVLAIGAFAACNDSATTADAEKKTDSVATEATNSIDSTKKAADSTINAVADSTKAAVDTTKK